MRAQEPHREIITSELKEALGRDDEARRIQEATEILDAQLKGHEA